jgi:hypothetical protein
MKKSLSGLLSGPAGKSEMAGVPGFSFRGQAPGALVARVKIDILKGL